jgi:hypothetical protein
MFIRKDLKMSSLYLSLTIKNTMKMRISNHLNTLRRLGLGDYIKYVFLKRWDPLSAGVLYVRRACEDLLKTGIHVKTRRSVALKGYLVTVSLKDVESRNFIARIEDLEILKRFFIDSLREIFCDKIYHIDDPSSYDLLIDIGSTLGEFSLYVIHKGFRGEIITIEPLAVTTFVVSGKYLDNHHHYYLAINSSDVFEKIFVRAKGRRSIIKIDCEGCEKHFNLDLIDIVEKNSLFFIEVHNKDLLRSFVKKLVEERRMRITIKPINNEAWLLRFIV